LLIAASAGHDALCDFLISRGADMNARTEQRRTAMSYACSRGRIKVLNVLLQHGAKITPMCLDAAARLNHLDIVKLLLEHGAKINAEDNEGNTPLHQVSE